MPRLKPRPRFEDDDVVTPIASYATSYATRNTGVRLRASHPAVKAHPHHWRVADLPDDEAPVAVMPEVPQHPPEPSPPHVPIDPENTVICTTGFSLGLGGRGVAKGQTLQRDDPIVKAHPEYFATLGRPLTEAG